MNPFQENDFEPIENDFQPLANDGSINDFEPLDSVRKPGKTANPFRLLDAVGKRAAESSVIMPGVPYRDIPGVISAGVDEAAFGIPKFIAGKMGKQLPEAESAPGKLASGAARVGGFMLGGPMKLAGKAAGKLAPKFIRSAAEGAASLGSTALTQPEEIPGNAAMGAAGGVAAEVVGAGLKGFGKAAQGVRTLFSEDKQVKLAEKAREIFNQVKSGSGQAFEASMKQLPGQINIADDVAAISKLNQNPETAAVLEEAIANAAKVGDDSLIQVLTDSSMTSVSPLEAHRVATTLEQIPSILRQRQANPNLYQSGGGKLLKMGDYDRIFSELAKAIKAKIAQAHPDAYSKIIEQYGKIQRGAQLLTPEFSQRGNRLIKNIKSGFNGGEIAKAATELMPGEIMKEVFGVAKAKKAVDTVNPLNWIRQKRF